MNLRDLAVDPRTEEELIWRWSYADGEMGLSSTFPAMVARLECGGRTGGRPIMEIPEHQLIAAERARRIDRTLEAIGKPHENVLRACYGPDATPLRELGATSGLAPLTGTARRAWMASGTDRPLEEWLVRLCYRVRKRVGDQLERDRALVLAIRREAESMRLSATRAYSAARRARR